MEGLKVQIDARLLEKERNHFGVIRCKHCTLERSGFEVTGIDKALTFGKNSQIISFFF